MPSYESEVRVIHKKFQDGVKKARTAKSLDRVYNTHKKDHDRLLKKHLKEEAAQISSAKKKLA